LGCRISAGILEGGESEVVVEAMGSVPSREDHLMPGLAFWRRISILCGVTLKLDFEVSTAEKRGWTV
jgi:hypothetical protein